MKHPSLLNRTFLKKKRNTFLKKTKKQRLLRFIKQTLSRIPYSVVDQFTQNDFFGSTLYAIHPADPFHLILGF